jgi:hypothetical protein
LPFSSEKSNEKELSINIILLDLAKDSNPVILLSIVGRENAKTILIISNVRIISRRICFNFIRRILFFCISLRNCNEENSIVFNFLRFNICRIIGSDAANSPNKKAGFIKSILFLIFKELQIYIKKINKFIFLIKN